MEVRNRFKGLDLIDRVPDELWNEVRDIVQETGIKTIPMEKKCKKAKWLSEEALQIAMRRREVKNKGEKEAPRVQPRHHLHHSRRRLQAQDEGRYGEGSRQSDPDAGRDAARIHLRADPQGAHHHAERIHRRRDAYRDGPARPRGPLEWNIMS